MLTDSYLGKMPAVFRQQALHLNRCKTAYWVLLCALRMEDSSRFHLKSELRLLHMNIVCLIYATSLFLLNFIVAASLGYSFPVSGFMEI